MENTKFTDMEMDQNSSFPKRILGHLLSFVIAVAGFWILYWLLSWGLYGISSTSNNQSLMKWLAATNDFTPAKSWNADTDDFHDKLNSAIDDTYESPENLTMNSEMEKEEEVPQSPTEERTQPAASSSNNASVPKEETAPQEKPKEKEPNKVFTFVDQKPEFPGGDAALYKFISDNLIYPPTAVENGIQGRVIVQFVVTKTGSIGNVKVVRSVDHDLDNEAIRVCKKLPNFIPGKQDGQPVNVWYTLPITFRLQ